MVLAANRGEMTTFFHCFDFIIVGVGVPAERMPSGVLALVVRATHDDATTGRMTSGILSSRRVLYILSLCGNHLDGSCSARAFLFSEVRMVLLGQARGVC